MLYKGLEYKDEYVVFDNQEDALYYKGDKKVILDNSLILSYYNLIKSLGNIYAVNGNVDIDGSNVISLGKLKYCGIIWLNKKQAELFKERIATKEWRRLYNAYHCQLKGGNNE